MLKRGYRQAYAPVCKEVGCNTKTIRSTTNCRSSRNPLPKTYQGVDCPTDQYRKNDPRVLYYDSNPSRSLFDDDLQFVGMSPDGKIKVAISVARD